MTTPRIRTLVTRVLTLTLAGALAGCAAHPRSEAVDGLTFMVPASWVSEPPTTEMRRAQYVLPGDAGDATVIVYYFGEGSAGSIEANMARWAGQIDGDEDAEYGMRVIQGMTVHTIDARGRYVAAVNPGSDDRHDEPGWMLRAAIIETGAGPYYVKAVGPEATLNEHAAHIDAFIDTVAWNGDAAPQDAASHP